MAKTSNLMLLLGRRAMKLPTSQALVVKQLRVPLMLLIAAVATAVGIIAVLHQERKERVKEKA
ncbi:hypothetical protein [Escherichia coli]|uniref:hypothetical protein n=1 Tax=Escherichia coli TaxID=562 RepID=UPI003079FDE9